MKLSKLFYKHKDEIIYILGTGPSAEFFPFQYLRNKIVIGLNNAYQLYPYCKYNLTIHPELIPKDFHRSTNQVWITKHKDWLSKNYPATLDRHIYWFKNNKSIHDYNYLNVEAGETLYVGRGIATGACCLAAKMGARIVVLIGCDMSTIHPKVDSRGNLSDSGGCQIDDTQTNNIYYQSISNKVNFNGLSPEQVTKEYYLSLSEVRRRLEGKLQIMSLSPFSCPEYWKEEYLEYKKEPPPTLEDGSKYTRDLDFE